MARQPFAAALACMHGQVMWQAAADCACRLRESCHLAPDEISARAAQRAQARQREAAAATAAQRVQRPSASPALSPEAAAKAAQRQEKKTPPRPKLILKSRALAAAAQSAAKQRSATEGAADRHADGKNGARLKRLRRVSQGAQEAGDDADAALEDCLADDESPEGGEWCLSPHIAILSPASSRAR